MASSGIGSKALFTAQVLMVLRLVNPADYGAWAAVLLLLTYALYGHLGAEYGLGVKVPYHEGRGDYERVTAALDTLYISWTGQALLLGLAVAVYAGIRFGALPRVTEYGLWTASALLLVQQQQAFYTRLHSLSSRFARLGRSMFVSSAVSVLTVPVLTWRFGIAGTMLATVLVGALYLFLLRAGVSYSYRGTLSIAVLVELLVAGFPLFLAGLGGKLIDTVDRAVVAVFLGPVQMGYYSLLAIPGSLLLGILYQPANVMSPRISAKLGAHSDDPRMLGQYLVRPTLAFSWLAAMGVGVSVLLLPSLIKMLLPDYTPALRALDAYLPGVFFLSVIGNANTILNIVMTVQGRQRLLILLQVAVVLVEVGAAYLLVRAGLGIVGVALASTFAHAFYCCAVLWLAIRLVLGRSRQSIRFAADALMPALYAGSLVILVRWLMGDIPSETLLASVRNAVAFGLMFMVVFLIHEPRHLLVRTLRVLTLGP